MCFLAVTVFHLWIWGPCVWCINIRSCNILLYFSFDEYAVIVLLSLFWPLLVWSLFCQIVKQLHLLFSWVHVLGIPFSIFLPWAEFILVGEVVCFLDAGEKWILYSICYTVSFCWGIENINIENYQWTLFIDTCYFVVASVTAPKGKISWLVGELVYTYSYEGLSWIPALWRERYPDLLGNQAVPKAEVPWGMVLPRNLAPLRERAVMAEFCSVLLMAFPSERIHFFSIPAQDVISSASLCLRGDPCRNVAISSGKLLLLLPSPKGLPSRDVSCFFCSAPLRKFLSRDSAPRSKRFSPKIFQDIYLARRSPGEWTKQAERLM